MIIEHIGICVDNPISMAEWWVTNLDFKFLRILGDDNLGAAFIEDGKGTVIEIGKIPEVNCLDLNRLEPMQLHFALECIDPMKEAERLVNKGARFVGEAPRNEYLHEKILVCDPWGACIQLVNRKEKLK